MGALSDLLLQNAPDRADSELKITHCVPAALDIVKVTSHTFIPH